ncbi:MAG TPA: hypothetical protein VNJ04_17890 [Gemmatimonadaceae bacterium]|nr:hypothetical protein [Gemmatimonadaceae bacterium]
MKEGLDRPGFLLELGIAEPKRQRTPAPFVGRRHRRNASLLADDPAQEHFDICTRDVGHGRRGPFAFADDGEGSARLARRTRARPRLFDLAVALVAIAKWIHARATAVVVIASTEAAHDPKRLPLGVGGYHGVHPIGLARTAEVLDGIAGAAGAGGHRVI